MKYAVIDIGSNSIKMSLADIQDNEYTIEQLFKRSLRLLSDGRKIIREEEIEFLLGALLFFQEEINKHQCEYRIMATSAIRRAENGDEVISRVQKNLSMQIEVISGDEEASLVCLAHQHLFNMYDGHHLIFDIGGGSLECIEVVDGEKKFQQSTSLGALVVKNFFVDKKYKKNHIEKVFFTIQNKLQNLEIPKAKKKTRVYISGGNPSAVSKMNLKHHQIHYDQLHGEDVYLRELHTLLKVVRKFPPQKLMDLYDVKPHRADLAIPTIVLIGAILDLIEADFYTISKTGIREGEIIRTMKAQTR